MKIIKNDMPLDEMAEIEYAKCLIAEQKAVQDYNIMMGYLEDPLAEDEEEEQYVERAQPEISIS